METGNTDISDMTWLPALSH